MCSFAFTGEDAAAVEKRMKLVVDTFEAMGISAYCNLFDERTQGFTGPKQYVLAARDEMRQRDVLFVLMVSDRRSEGQLIEIGTAVEREMPVILAHHESAIGKTYIDKIADEVFTWTDDASLVAGIQSLV